MSYIKYYVNYEEWRLKRVAEERGKQIAAKKVTEILQNRLALQCTRTNVY